MASMSADGGSPRNGTRVREPDFDDVDFSAGDIRSVLAEYEGRAVFFRRCDFIGVDMQDLNLADAVFEACTFKEAKLRECVLDRARVMAGSWEGADLASTDLSRVVFNGVDLARTRFTGAMFDEVQFTECRMIGADLTALRGLAAAVKFQNCNLQLASFQGTKLRGAIFSGSDLTEAELRGTDLRDAVFDGCRLRHVDLSHTRLDGTDLRGADLGEITADSPRHLRGAVISHAQAVDICAALGLTVLD